MKVLVVKTSALGDVVQALDVLGPLKEHGATVDWVVEKPCSSLLLAHPDIDRVIEIDTKAWRKNPFQKGVVDAIRALRQTKYDYVFDLQGNCKSAVFTGLSRAKSKIGFGRATVPEWPNLLVTDKKIDPPAGKNIRDDYLFLVEAVVGHGSRVVPAPTVKDKVAIVCPGSAWPNKQMSPDVLIAFLKCLELNIQVIWGTDSERQLACEIADKTGGVVVDRLSLPQLHELMGGATLVVSMDSLPLHLAGSTDTLTFGVFGPSNGDKYAPHGDNHLYFQGSCPYDEVFVKRCSKLRTCPTGACIKGVTVEALISCFRSSPRHRHLLRHKTPLPDQG